MVDLEKDIREKVEALKLVEEKQEIARKKQDRLRGAVAAHKAK